MFKCKGCLYDFTVSSCIWKRDVNEADVQRGRDELYSIICPKCGFTHFDYVFEDSQLESDSNEKA